MWLKPLEALGDNGDPATEILAYIERKLDLSRKNPTASRLFAMEIMQGAPILGKLLGERLKRLVDEKATLINQWVADGRLAPIDPHHLIFMIWATTQHYADFEAQIHAVLGGSVDINRHFDTARKTLEQVFLNGIKR